MGYKTLFYFTVVAVGFISCWKPKSGSTDIQPVQKVMGYKPVYGTEANAKKILYTAGAKPVIQKGNIYAFQNYIFQVDPGTGIHVIDNSNPAAAVKIGFIEVKGCSQMSIKDGKLYTNSYDDLVVLDFSNLNNIQEYSRLKGVFVEYRYYSLASLPPGTGYYECPSNNGFITGWTRDSVVKSCFRN